VRTLFFASCLFPYGGRGFMYLECLMLSEPTSRGVICSLVMADPYLILDGIAWDYQYVNELKYGCFTQRYNQ
jgi:hypothetical protein